MLEKEKQERRLIRDTKIEVILSSGTILKQGKERKLVKGFSSGMIPERIGKFLVVISFQESSNSSIWDELNFENSRYTTVSLSHLGTDNRKTHKEEMQHIRVGKLVKVRKMADREEGAGAPNQRQEQNQQQNQEVAR